MTTRNTPTTFGLIARSFHWLTALVILTAIPLGVIANDMATGPDTIATKAQLFSIHKTLGVAAFFLGFARILWAMTQARPVSLHPERRLETATADLIHWLLYLSLMIVPLSGWIHHAAVDGFAPILWPFGQGLPMVPKSETVAALAGSTHWLFTKVLAVSILLHIAGALKHVIIDRDQTMARMTKGVSAGKAGHGHALAPLAIALAVFAAGGTAAWQMAAAKAPAEAAASAPTAATGGNWAVQEGALGFSVKQMGADVAATLPVWSATIDFDEATGTGKVTVEIDTTKLTLGSVTDQAKGPEFFDVANHPGAVFTADISPAAKDFTATGTLSLRGRQVPVTLPFTLAITGDSAKMQGSVTLDRRDFGMGPSYADEATVGFGVTVTVDLTATRAP